MNCKMNIITVWKKGEKYCVKEGEKHNQSFILQKIECDGINLALLLNAFCSKLP